MILFRKCINVTVLLVLLTIFLQADQQEPKLVAQTNVPNNVNNIKSLAVIFPFDEMGNELKNEKLIDMFNGFEYRAAEALNAENINYKIVRHLKRCDVDKNISAFTHVLSIAYGMLERSNDKPVSITWLFTLEQNTKVNNASSQFQPIYHMKVVSRYCGDDINSSQCGSEISSLVLKKLKEKNIF